MAIKTITEETINFVPTYGHNREDADPLWVKIHPLTRAEADSYRDQMQFTQRKGFREGVTSNIRTIQKRQFTDNVKEVHNFVDGKTGEEVTDVKRFYEEAPDDLVEEIFDAMLNASLLSENDIKNSESQSGGSRKERAGTAETAKNTPEKDETV